VAWNYSLSHPADAEGYYAHVDFFSEFSSGTGFILWLTAWLRDLLEASYLDMYMVFHLFGYLGVVLFYRLGLRALSNESDPDRLGATANGGSRLLHAIAFLPGLHFWTSFIGKDGLMFLGILCFVWGMARPHGRVLALVFGLSLCALIRPHIAGVLAASCAIAAAFSKDTPLSVRLTLLGVVVVGVALALPFLKEFVGLESISTEGVTEFVEVQQGHNLEGGSSVDISRYSLPLQLFTFLYRPLFIDTNGALGILASCENLGLLVLSLFLAPPAIRVLRSSSQSLYARFNALFWAFSTVIMATTVANMGLAMRQKVMVLPSLLILLLMAYAARPTAEATEHTEATV
jgi:hypothetical protein